MVYKTFGFKTRLLALSMGWLLYTF